MGTCKICGSNDVIEYLKDDQWPLLKCNNCKVVWQKDFPTEEELIDFYSKEYYQSSDDKDIVRTQGNESTILNYKRSLYTYRSIISNIGKKKSILDVGCGNNYLLNFAKSDKWQCCGLEMSVEAASRLINDGVEVFIGAIDDFKDDTRKFELITMFHVLEHLSNPIRDLEIIKSKMDTNGVLIIEVPDIGSKIAQKNVRDWWLFQPNEHLFYYSKESLTYLMNSIGLEIFKTEIREGLGFSRGKNNASSTGFSLRGFVSAMISRAFWIKVAFEKFVNFLGYNNVIRIYVKKQS